MKKPDPVNEKIEYWDLYHADGRFEKVIPSRGYNIPPDMYHMTVEVIPTDREGHILVTQRSFSKRIGPGKLEFPAGSVRAGEQPYVAAKRELLEETGLKAVSVQKLGTYVIPRIQRTVYLAYIPDLCTAKVTLQENETIGYTVVTFEEWLQFLAQERFETSKLRNYSAQMLNKMESIVGKPHSVEKTLTPTKELKKISEDIFARYRVTPLNEEPSEPVTFNNLFPEEGEGHFQ